MGQRGFFGASVGVDPESLLTPFLIVCWLKVVLRGFRRAHGVLRRFYDLSGVHSSKSTVAWQEVKDYFLAFGWKPETTLGSGVLSLLHRYSLTTTRFLFGRASQHRLSRCH